MNLRGPDDRLASSIGDTLRAAWMPGDWFELNDQVVQHYAWKASIARDAFIHCYRPEPFRLVEIGTRCGYSLRAFRGGVGGEAMAGHDAVDALCIDAGIDDDSPACLDHFLKWVRGNSIPVRLVQALSLRIDHLYPAPHFAHVDGDHSFIGCLNDLNLVCSAAVILVDDCDNLEVKRAVDTFLRGLPSRAAQYVNDGLRTLGVISWDGPSGPIGPRG